MIDVQFISTLVSVWVNTKKNPFEGTLNLTVIVEGAGDLVSNSKSGCLYFLLRFGKEKL